jgi:hypothetical protein
MNYTSLFYWLTVADNAKLFFGWFAIFFTIIFIIVQFVRVIAWEQLDEKDINKINKWTWYSTPFMTVFISLWLFTPSKKDALIIVAGGSTLNFLTTDSSARQIPSELSNFLVTEIKNLAQDAKVELNIATQKEKVLEEVKNLSSSELIDKLKSDSTLKSILLEK